MCSTTGLQAQDRPDDHHDNRPGEHRDGDRHDGDHRGSEHAQGGHDQGGPHNFVRHDEWHKGGRMDRKDWKRGERMDYRAYHLDPPPHGYEWRQIDGNYVLATISGGLILHVVIGSGH